MATKNIIFIGLILIIITLTTVSVSAGFFDWFEKTITGRAGSRPTNVTVTLTGINPAVINYVSAISATTPTELGVIPITFSVHMYDPDGVADLNDTSVYANFTMPSPTTPQMPRTNESYCTLVADLDANTANYSCGIDMWYFDESGTWGVYVRGSDLGNGTMVFNTTTEFTYNQLKAMVIAPVSLTWLGLNVGAKNQTSNNDPTYINNTGNYNGTIDITGKDLLGEADSSYTLAAGNFSMDVNSGGDPPAECNRTNVMLNGTAITVAYSYSNPGNLSVGSGTGQEEFYYCISEVPQIMSQTYSTKSGSWTISY